MQLVVFVIATLMVIGGALGVIVRRHPVHAALSLVLTLFGIAVHFVSMEAHFLAAVQIIVYAGAIMVLFMFVIMLLNLGHDYQPDLRFTLWLIVPDAVSGALFGFLARQIWGVNMVAGAGGEAVDAMVAEYGAIGAIARPLYTRWVVPFEITGILLLVAVVGALVLAKRRV